MKKILLIISILFLPNIISANSFSDLESICTWTEDGSHMTSGDKLILKHINKRITKTEGFVKIDDYMYMVANTFTDNYRFLGSYFLRYDCRERKIKYLSPLLKGNNPGELGFLYFDESTNNMKIMLVGNANLNTTWIYDYTEQKLKKVDYKKVSIKKSKNRLMSLSTDLSSYDGYSVNIEVLYYNKVYVGTGYSYQYENLGNPDIVNYTF